MEEQQRIGATLRAIDTKRRHPRRNLFLKLHNYTLSRSHGIATPQVFGIADSIATLPWDNFPDQFVIKSNGGAAGRGVLPLERHGEHYALIGSDTEYTREDVAAHYADARGVRKPFFVESVVEGPDNAPPVDAKVYAFYGETAFTLLRRVASYDRGAEVKYRFIDPEGKDLGQIHSTSPRDETIPAPTHLELVDEIASTLSKAVPLPFLRVDLYQIDSGFVVGELTPLPGSARSFSTEYDARLGLMYDQAEARLQLDLAKGRRFDIKYGPHDRDLLEAVQPTHAMPGTKLSS